MLRLSAGQMRLLVSGILYVAGSIWFASSLPRLRKLVRPIYRELGIIEEVAAGLQTASGFTAPPEE